MADPVASRRTRGDKQDRSTGRRDMADKVADHEAWPLRASGLAALGAVFAMLIDRLINITDQLQTEDPLRLAAAFFLGVSGIALGFTLERVRPLWSAAFAVAAGLVVALVFFSNGSPAGWSAGDEWRIFAALLVVAIAAPLFQAARDEGRWRLDYAPIHANAWTNIVLWCAAWAFVFISWLLAQLLAELFNLIGIDLLREALRESWFNALIIGAALGGAIGLLRDRDTVLGLLQRVVTTVLSVLAPVLALGLVLFVLALPFTGLQPLWDKTTATTPILLMATVGAFLLANAVIGNAPDEEARSRVVRLSAAALAAVMAPLAIVAAISTWLRIDQYGFTPERLWAAVFVLVILAISLAYLWTVVRGRLGWAERVRPVNVRLAIGISIVALLLATPLVDFGAISTRDQIARLESGQVKPDEFDWAALRFDFGPAGRRALERIRDGGPANLRALAAQALATKDRWAAAERVRARGTSRRIGESLRVLPAPVPVPPELQLAIAQSPACHVGSCALIWRPGQREAITVGSPCEGCQAQPTRIVLDPKGVWQVLPNVGPDIVAGQVPDSKAQQRAIASGQVEVRPVQLRQVFVDGQPVGAPF
jgi:hypothetical protein